MRGFFKFNIVICFIVSLLLCAAPLTNAEEERRELEFTPEEENYIAAHKSLKIGYVQDRIPVSFSDENGQLAGISRYIFDYVSELCGLKFEYVPLPAGDVTYEYLLNEGLDLVSSVEYNKENQQARGILISNPYLSGRKVVVAREGTEFRYDANLSIAISTGSQTIRKVLGAQYPNFELVDYPSIQECFDAVNSGKADLMMQNQYVVEYWITKPIYEKLKVIPVLGLDDELCFSAVVAFGGGAGVAEEDGRTLIGILNKAIAAMTEDEVGSFTIQAIAENQYRYNFSDFMYRYRYSVRLIGLALLIILLLSIMLIRVYTRFTENKADAKAKRRFLSMMSHEIRTPLNGIIGLNYLMSQNSGDKERTEDYLRRSTMTANYLLSLVNDMLDMSSLQAENMKLTLRPVDFELLINTVSSIAENAMSGKKIKYSVDYTLTQRCILGDEVRIQQVLLNLLDNARKFTPEGGNVELKIRQKTEPNGKILTIAEISDDGLGMSEDFQKRIFDAFARELKTVSKGNQGTGLGLPISRRLALLMGGDITFTSGKNAGSTFVFTFAAEPAQLPPENSAVQHTARSGGLRILVAEDNELNGEIILEMLRENGFEGELAENGKIALKKFSDSLPGTFGVVLMDLLMPEMNGFETAKAIRALDRTDAETVRIFACTANSSDEDREKAFAAGMDEFIAKPLNVGELLDKING